LYNALREYKEPKKPMIIKLERERPVRFRLIKDARVKNIPIEYKNNWYDRYVFKVRDLSDGKFKIMSLSTLAFRTLGNIVGTLEANDENISNYDFIVTKVGEGQKTAYDIRPKKRL
jgi:hypothetical protein